MPASESSKVTAHDEGEMTSPSQERMRYMVRNYHKEIDEDQIETVVKEAVNLYSSGAGTIENAVTLAVKNYQAGTRGGSRSHGSKAKPRGW